MNRKSFLLLAVLLSCLTISAGTSRPDNDELRDGNESKEAVWSFYSAIRQPSAEKLANESDYKFGELAGCLYTLFLDYYVVREQVVAGDPTRRTIIRKPAIYQSVRTIEKQLSKDLKKGNITKEEATQEFTQVLKVAISAVDSESDSFEKALQASRKDAKKLLALYDSVRLTEI